MIVEKINNSYIKYSPTHGNHSKEYYYYCIDIIKNFLYKTNKNYNVIFGNYENDFNNLNKTIKIDIQLEHTLVKYGGRSVDNIVYGNAKNEDGVYLVRIDKYDYLNSLDLVLEYSLSNYFNILKSEKFDNFIKKVIYVSPLIYDINFDCEFKQNTISIFSLNNNDRRLKIFNELSNLDIKYKNIDNIFCKNEILNLYKTSKILVNVHQTDHHHTFEELRVLPALLNGVIIISEKSALSDYIPYNKYIIWCNYEELKSKVNEVYNNYDYYYNKIFKDGKLNSILENMKICNLHAFNEHLL